MGAAAARLTAGRRVPFTVLVLFQPAEEGVFFFNDTATTEIYTLSLHDALPIFSSFLSRNPTRSRALLFQDVTFLGHANGRLSVLFEQKPLLDEAAGRILHSRHEPRV